MAKRRNKLKSAAVSNVAASKAKKRRKNPDNLAWTKSAHKLRKSSSQSVRGNFFGRLAKSPTRIHIKPKISLSPTRNAAYLKIIQEILTEKKRKAQFKEVSVDANGNLVTPQKTRMYLVYTDDLVEVYVDENVVPERAEVDPAKIDVIMARKLPQAPVDGKKLQTHAFDGKILTKVKKEKEQNNNQRKPTQSVVMNGVTAAEAATAYGLDPTQGKGWEWLHLVAHSMRGNKGQKENNLVLGTAECNSAMLLLEFYLEEKSIKDKIKIDIEVKVELAWLSLDGVNLEPTHLAKRIFYRVKYAKEYLDANNRTINKNIDVTIEFDPLLRYQPPEELGDGYEALFKVAEEYYQKGPVSKPIQARNLAANQVFGNQAGQMNPNASSFSSAKICKQLSFTPTANFQLPSTQNSMLITYADPNTLASSVIQTLTSAPYYIANQAVTAWHKFTHFFNAHSEEGDTDNQNDNQNSISM